MILHNIVPIKILDNYFFDYVSFNANSWNFNLDFKTYFILTTIRDTNITIIPRQPKIDIKFLSNILHKTHRTRFTDYELIPVKI